MEEAILSDLEHRGRVVAEGAVRLTNCGDGAVACVGHRVVALAYGFVGEFVARILLVSFGDALLSADGPMLHVRTDVRYLHSQVVCAVG